jgi:copper(I)-binding protein
VSTLRSTRSRTVMAAVLVALAPLVAACGTGQKAPTRLEYAVTDGVQTHAGNVVLRNVYLTAAVPVGVSSKSLALQGVIANNTGANDSLIGVTANSTPFSSAKAAVPVVPGTPVSLGTGGLRLSVSNLPAAVLPGSLVSLTFAFQQSGQVTVAVPVYTLASREPGAEPSGKVKYPTPELPDGYNQNDVDNRPAA